MSGFTRAQMEAIAARDNYYCTKCGTFTDYWVVHNRYAMPVRDLDLAAGVLLCWPCAVWADTVPVESAVLGYRLLDEDDPTHVPILIFGRGRVLLTSDGRYVSQEVPF